MKRLTNYKKALFSLALAMGLAFVIAGINSWADPTYNSISIGNDAFQEGSASVTILGYQTPELHKTEAVEPTCTKEGNRAYWTCGMCGKWCCKAFIYGKRI